MRYKVLSALALLLATPSLAATDPFGPYATPQQRVEVAPGRSIHMVCMGQGSPAVILSAGADGWSADWRLVQPRIAKKTKVCAWDRAGHGFSSGSPEPQDIAHTEADLERALAGAGLTRPVLMVAHSRGGFEALLFADRDPERVAGMVLVDPSTPDQEEQLARAAPALMAWSGASDAAFLETIRACIAALKRGEKAPPADCVKLDRRYPEPLRANLLAAGDPQYWQAYLAMFEARAVDAKLAINAKRNYAAMPLVVLDAGVFRFPTAPAAAQKEAPAAKAVITAGHEALARLSTRGALVRVPGSAHAIALQEPDAVIGAVETMIDEVRART